MSNTRNRINPFILPASLGIIGAIIAGGNKDNPTAIVGLLIGILLGVYVTARINGKIKL